MPKQQNKPSDSSVPSNGKKYLLGPVATVFVDTKTGSWRIERPVVDITRCVFCGTCQKHCPTDVVTVEKEGNARGVSFDFDYCKGCGICANVCPKQCITMLPEKGECGV